MDRVNFYFDGVTILNSNAVVLDGYTLNPGDNPWSALSNTINTDIYERSLPHEVQERSQKASVLVVNKVRIDREMIAALPNLRFITVTATGFDCVDVAAARECGIPVSNVPVYGTDSVAQHVFAVLLHILHRIDSHDSAIRNGHWQRTGDFSFWLSPLTELARKTIGIIGFGRIGRRVGEIANVFGMRVLANSRSQTATPNWPAFDWANVEHIAAESDVVTLHCPLTNETQNLVDSEFLSKCKPTSILINTGRGPLVNEADLAAALNAGQLAAAGLDVVSQEPINEDNPVLQAKNCFLTPHMAWATLEARQRLMATTVDNVKAFLAGQPQNVVNP
ncbi:MAG: D-2-hydroxyacid dehydrogenase [Planctomycetales bacterium]|nr:D-2-hydroxyacid dehydrogenase [Planctomycetales bacterium]